MAVNMHHVSSVGALMEYVPDIQMDDLGYPGIIAILSSLALLMISTAELEREQSEDITTATIKVSPVNPNQPATIRIAATHVRISCVCHFTSYPKRYTKYYSCHLLEPPRSYQCQISVMRMSLGHARRTSSLFGEIDKERRYT